MRLLELNGEVRSCLTLAQSVVGFSFTSAGEFDCTVQVGSSQLWWEREAKYGWFRTVCYIPSGLETLWVLMALGVPSTAVSRAPNCGIVWSIVHCQSGVTGVKSGWLAICSDTSGEQLGKDVKWHNVTTCTSVDFASEASTVIWAYFSRHGDSCPSFGECINVDCSDVDVFWVSRLGRACW